MTSSTGFTSAAIAAAASYLPATSAATPIPDSSPPPSMALSTLSPAASELAPPSQQARLLQHKMANINNTTVTPNERKCLTEFWASWWNQPFPNEIIKMNQIIHEIDGSKLLEELFKTYDHLKRLKNLFRQTENDDMQRKLFIRYYLLLISIFNQCCERDNINICHSNLEKYPKYYAEILHPNFLIFRKLFNLAAQILKKDHPEEFQKQFGMIFCEGIFLAFYRDKMGYIPIAVGNGPLEIIYPFYGEAQLNLLDRAQHVFVIKDHRLVTQRGFILEYDKCHSFLGSCLPGCSPGDPAVLVRGYLGANSTTPFCCTYKTNVWSPNLEISALMHSDASLPNDQNDPAVQPASRPQWTLPQLLASCLLEEIKASERRGNERDVFFIPIPPPNEGIESDKFIYLLLQDLLEKGSQPKEQQWSRKCITHIEQEEQQSIEQIMKSLEETIKAEFRHQVEVEQRERPGTNASMKSGKRSHLRSPQIFETWVDKLFKEFVVERRLHYTVFLKFMNLCLKRDIRDMEDLGVATLVKAQGSSGLAAGSSNRFLKNRISLIHEGFTAQTSGKM
jgi:hypothetical protein